MNTIAPATTTALMLDAETQQKVALNMGNLEKCLFPVAETELLFAHKAHAENGPELIARDETHKVIYRKDTTKVVGVHTDAYKLVANKDVFEPLLASLLSSGINTEGMITEVYCPYDGAQTIVNFRFPNERIAIHSKEGLPDELEMVITVVNSYNGMWAFRADLGAFRLICRNGAYIGGKMMDIYARHTSGLEVEETVAALDRALVTFKANEELWKKWALAKVNIDQARAMLEGAAFLSGKALEDVLDRFTNEADRLGKMTVWALFNGLTEWATHAETRNQGENSEAIKYKRQQQVAAFTSGKKFLELAANPVEPIAA